MVPILQNEKKAKNPYKRRENGEYCANWSRSFKTVQNHSNIYYTINYNGDRAENE
jgi:hypothetical protein